MSAPEDARPSQAKNDPAAKRPPPPSKSPEPPLPPLTVAGVVGLLLRLVVVVVIVSAAAVLFVGLSAVGGDAAPADLPPSLAQHLEQGAFVPVWDGKRSLSLFVARHGLVDHSEETVLLLHSVPGSSLSLAPMQRALAAQRIATLAPDLPGFGLSDRASGAPLDTPYLAQAIKEMLVALHVDSVHLYAEGTSCAVAHHFVRHWPALLNSVVLARCTPPPVHEPSLLAFAVEHSRLLPDPVRRLWFGAGRDDALTAAANRWLLLHKRGHEAYFQYCRSNAAAQPAPQLGGYGAPCEGRRCGALEVAPTPAGFVVLHADTDALAVQRFLEALPSEARQHKQARAPPRVVYSNPTPGDAYGLAGHDHAGHAHGGCTHGSHARHDHAHEGHAHEHAHEGHEHAHDHGHEGHEHEHAHEGHEHAHAHDHAHEGHEHAHDHAHEGHSH